LANADWDAGAEHEYIAMARRASMDGILVSAARVTNDELKRTGIPTVILGSHSLFPDFDQVGIDTERGSADAAQYLVELGHHRIAMITPLALNSGQKRHRGFLAGLATSGLTERPEYLIDAPYTQEGGYQATRQLLTLREPPTAIFASNDQLAIGALACAREHGVAVPESLSIVGLDDIDAASVTSPPLTTLRRPQYEYGETAMRFLLERIAGTGPTELRRHLYPCALVVRGSTAPPPNRSCADRAHRED
jgi:DNA-binding LacI/PurR family transcriptional regulator